MGTQNSIGDDDEEEEFEFCVVKGNSDDVTAGEIFDNGQIRTLYHYPVFVTDAPLEAPVKPTAPEPARERVTLGMLLERETESELGVESGGSYCLWNPDEKRAAAKTTTKRPFRTRMMKRSNSTGSVSVSVSVSKRWKLKNLLLRRSNSHRKE